MKKILQKKDFNKLKYSTFTQKSKYDVVIIGGGVIGTSVGYHLCKEGFKNVLLLEQGKLSCGTSWHAAGLIGQLRPTESETELSKYGAELYAKLESETGQSTSFKRCGSLTLASSKDRMHQLKVTFSRARSFGIEAHLVDREEASKLWNGLIKKDDIEGALWLPGDGTATSTDVVNAFAIGGKQYGLQIKEDTKVVSIETKPSNNGQLKQISSVTTDKGERIECEYVVNCGGMWANNIGKLCGSPVPLQAAEHFYIVTKALKDVNTSNLPVLRDPNAFIYYREWSGGILMGGFEPKAKPCFEGGSIPDNFQFQLFQEDWDHFEILMNGALNRTPILNNCEIMQMVNGPESFTSDNKYILGESPHVLNLFIVAGFNSSGIASSAGVGKAAAEWMKNGYSKRDLWTVSPSRFSDVECNQQFLKERVCEVLGLHYAINWPKYEFQSARNVRKSPFYQRLKNEGASFGCKFGWERPNWFAPKGVEPINKYSFGRQNWFEYVKEEHLQTRNDFCIFDQSYFSKFLVEGVDSSFFLNFISTKDISKMKVGQVVYTALLNERGGYESDLTISKLEENKFFVVTSTSQALRDMNWMKRNVPQGKQVKFTDVTNQYGVLSIMGPNSRKYLQQFTRDDLSNESFPFSTFKNIEIGMANLMASRITYVGELGYEMYIPVETCEYVFNQLYKKGEVKLGGYYAIDSLRTEKGYKAWGVDIGPSISPIEAGLSFVVDFDKEQYFLGKDSLISQKKKGVTKKIVNFKFVDEKAYPIGSEPIILDGKIIGYVCSASYGFSINSSVCMGFVNSDLSLSFDVNQKNFLGGRNFQIEIAGTLYPVVASLSPFVDPKGTKIKL